MKFFIFWEFFSYLTCKLLGLFLSCEFFDILHINHQITKEITPENGNFAVENKIWERMFSGGLQKE